MVQHGNTEWGGDYFVFEQAGGCCIDTIKYLVIIQY